MIYPTLISNIETILQESPKVKDIKKYPATDITAYPTAIFFPTEVTNDYATNQENFKVYTFKLYLVAGAKQTNLETLFNDVMPDVVDDVISKFDENWSDTVDGHRSWLTVESGTWTVSEQTHGIEVTAELTLRIRLLTDI
jgi:hypothetical protein